MSRLLSLGEAKIFVDRLRKSVGRKECWSCDCLQGLLTQLELDCPELAEAVEPLKLSAKEMHGCLGCDPCPPGALFAHYVRWQNESAQALTVNQGEGSAQCGPGCNCGAPSSGGKVKAAICLVVLLAVAGIIAYKAFSGRQQDGSNTAAGSEDGFTTAAAAQNPALEKESSAQDRGEPNKAAPSARDGTRIGEYLESLSELNKVALDQDVVFVFIPAKRDEVASDATRAAVLSGQRTLNSSNIEVGLYTLQTASPDYSQISSQVQLPAVLVAYKGRGMSAVSGEVTETRLLQSFMAVSRAGGCCPSGSEASGCE